MPEDVTGSPWASLEQPESTSDVVLGRQNARIARGM
jgi:hypothetical protein